MAEISETQQETAPESKRDLATEMEKMEMTIGVIIGLIGAQLETSQLLFERLHALEVAVSTLTPPSSIKPN